MVQQVLQRFGFTYSSPQATPLPTRHSLSALPSDESVEPSGPYPELVGCLMYLMTCTRPDLAYPLSILARYVAPRRHRPEHMAAAKRVLRYLCSTSGMGLVLGGRSPVVLTGHADASWADDQATQRSSQGYTFGLGSGSVSWRATRSSSVLGSSCEAEIYAGAMAAQELRRLTYLLTDLGESPRSPPVLYVDNKAMLALCREQRLEHRTKHIALRYFLARELQQRGQLRLAYVASEANTADVFTKALAPSAATSRPGEAWRRAGWAEELVAGLAAGDAKVRLRAVRDVKNAAIGSRTRKLAFIRLRAVPRCTFLPRAPLFPTRLPPLAPPSFSRNFSLRTLLLRAPRRPLSRASFPAPSLPQNHGCALHAALSPYHRPTPRPTISAPCCFRISVPTPSDSMISAVGSGLSHCGGEWFESLRWGVVWVSWQWCGSLGSGSLPCGGAMPFVRFSLTPFLTGGLPFALACLLACLPVFLPACLPAFLPAMPVCLPCVVPFRLVAMLEGTEGAEGEEGAWGAEEVQQAAAAVGSLACGLEEGVHAVLAAGAVLPLLRCLLHPHAKVVEAAARSLRLIFQSTHVLPRGSTAAGDWLSPALSLLPSLLASPNETVAEVAASVAAHCVHSPQQQAALAAAGGLLSLTRLLASSPRCTDAALLALAAAVRGTRQQAAALVDMGGGAALAAVVSLTRHPSPATRLNACRCLLHLEAALWPHGGAITAVPRSFLQHPAPTLAALPAPATTAVPPATTAAAPVRAADGPPPATGAAAAAASVRVEQVARSSSSGGGGNIVGGGGGVASGRGGGVKRDAWGGLKEGGMTKGDRSTWPRQQGHEQAACGRESEEGRAQHVVCGALLSPRTGLHVPATSLTPATAASGERPMRVGVGVGMGVGVGAAAAVDVNVAAVVLVALINLLPLSDQVGEQAPGLLQQLLGGREDVQWAAFNAHAASELVALLRPSPTTSSPTSVTSSSSLPVPSSSAFPIPSSSSPPPIPTFPSFPSPLIPSSSSPPAAAATRPLFSRSPPVVTFGSVGLAEPSSNGLVFTDPRATRGWLSGVGRRESAEFPSRRWMAWGDGAGGRGGHGGVVRRESRRGSGEGLGWRSEGGGGSVRGGEKGRSEGEGSAVPVERSAVQRESAAAALAVLCSSWEPIRRQALDLKVLQPLLRCLDASQPMPLRTAACCCLHSLSRSIKNLRTGLSTVPIILTVLNLACSPDASAQLPAVSALANLLLDFRGDTGALAHAGLLSRMAHLAAGGAGGQEGCMREEGVEGGVERSAKGRMEGSVEGCGAGSVGGEERGRGRVAVQVVEHSVMVLRNVAHSATTAVKQQLLALMLPATLPALLLAPWASVQVQAAALLRNVAHGAEDDAHLLLAPAALHGALLRLLAAKLLPASPVLLRPAAGGDTGRGGVRGGAEEEGGGDAEADLAAVRRAQYAVRVEAMLALSNVAAGGAQAKDCVLALLLLPAAKVWQFEACWPAGAGRGAGSEAAACDTPGNVEAGGAKAVACSAAGSSASASAAAAGSMKGREGKGEALAANLAPHPFHHRPPSSPHHPNTNPSLPSARLSSAPPPLILHLLCLQGCTSLRLASLWCLTNLCRPACPGADRRAAAVRAAEGVVAQLERLAAQGGFDIACRAKLALDYVTRES
ncbi:unnamed protein product [Closterium sp. NIES-54]